MRWVGWVPALAAREAPDLGHGRPGEFRARTQSRFVLPLINFIPDSLTYSVPLYLERHCDRTLRPGALPDDHAGLLPPGLLHRAGAPAR